MNSITLTRTILRDRKFISSILKIGVPIALQNLLTSSLSLLDNVMIGQLGEVQIAAVALANQVFFLFLLFIFGLGSGSAVFTAQYWGKKDIGRIRQVLGLCIGFSSAGGIAAGIVSAAFPQQVLSVFSKDPLVIFYGSGYLRIIAVSYIFTAVSFSFAMVLRSIGQTRLPVITTAISLVFNAVFNYLLIFGKLGFPQLGIRGAAAATAGARLLEMILLLTILYRQKNPLAGRFKDFVRLERGFISRYFKTVLPVIGNELGWAIGMLALKFVYARMGTREIAAITITEMVTNLLIVAFFGTSSACAVIVGNTIGKGKTATAYLFALRFAFMGPVLGFLCGILLAALSPVFPLLFNISPAVKYYVTVTLLITAGLLPIKIFNFHTVVGILRSGGDTTFSMVLDVGSVWFVGAGLAVLAGLVLHLPLPVVFLMAGAEEVVKSIIGFGRLRSRKWIRELT